MKEDIFRLVIDSINVQIDRIEMLKLGERFDYIQAEEEETSNDRGYLIYQCDGDYEFSYEDYKKMERQIEANTEIFALGSPVFLFDDLDQETRQYDKAYDQLKTAEEKRSIKELFDIKKSIYTKKGRVSLNVEEQGINFLEYQRDMFLSDGRFLNGYIYNVSYYELKKLFVMSGKDLFRENIRYGLIKETDAKKRL